MSGAVYVLQVVVELKDDMPVDQIKNHIQDAINDGAPEPLLWRMTGNRVTQAIKLPAGTPVVVR